MEKVLRISEEDLKTVLSYTDNVKVYSRALHGSFHHRESPWDLEIDSMRDLANGIYYGAWAIHELIEIASKEGENPETKEEE